ncbi:hypothetical protein C8R44DRAFT_237363 [Mycena epipterygia]|nr:hypothetical protein C8R44DRAFT_237363 [Mycena epipterygia]
MTSPETKRYTLTDAPPAIQVTTDATPPAEGRRESSIRRSSAMRYPRSQHTADGPTPLSAIETGYMSAFAAVELPVSQNQIDKIENQLSVPLGKANDAYDTLNTFYTANAATISSAAGALASAVNLDVKSIENTITTFAETSAVLMKGLDALGQLHPFVGVAVMAFKLVITLDITRRQNNKKVLAVKIQMQDMMTILFQLRHMRDPQDKGPDGTTLTDRFAGLMESIAKSITACGSACDVYVKKSFLAKTLKSKIYEGRLAGYVTMFANQKKDISFALQMHTALGVGEANKKLDGQDVHLKLIEDKMEALFRKLDTPRERDVQKFIDEKGGAKACVDNDGTLQELVSKSGESIAGIDPTRSGSGDLALAKKILNKELAEDVDEAFKKNMKLFDRKLDMQSKQLTDTINMTGEHIIHVLSGGAHEKILDTDLQAIWKEQGWKGSVKARHFVLALNDYYTEKFSNIDIAVAESNAGSMAGSAPASPLMSPISPAVFDLTLSAGAKHEDDRWALAYINVAHLQPIQESVDDDGTGFVSIKEANEFAVSRPPGWSLLSWVALWAAGWHATVTRYKNRIYKILAAMMSLLRHVKPANIQAVDTYLGGLELRRVELLLRSTRSAESTAYNDPRLTRIADTFEDTESEKLATQLKGLLYELDDTTTLRLITGTRRIERYVYPLIFHLLKHHFEILRLACIHVLDESEFDLMTKSLATVFEAVDERTRNLEAILKSTSFDVRERLANFAFGMFQLSYGPYKRDPVNNTILRFDEEDGFESTDPDLSPDSDDDEEAIKTILTRAGKEGIDVLRHDTQNEPSGVYDFEILHPPPATRVDPLDGIWTGQLLDVANGVTSALEGTMSMVLTRAEDKLSGAAENFLDILEVAGTVTEERKVVFTITWPDGYIAECTGQYDPGLDIISGFWEGTNGDDSSSEGSESDDDSSDDDSSSSSDEDEAEEVAPETTVGEKAEDEKGTESSTKVDEDTAPEQVEDADGNRAKEADDAADKDGEEAASNATDDSESSTESSSDVYPFVFTRTPAAAYRFRYSDNQFTENRARARWGFAIAATIDQVQRKRLSWPYLKQRFAERKRFLELAKRNKMNIKDLTPWTPLNVEESAEFGKFKSDLPPSDARFYYSVAEFEVHQLVAYNRDCDSCHRSIRGARIFCIQCMDDVYFDCIDLCIDCMDQTPERDAFVHTKSHVLIKTLRRLHDCDAAWLIPEARVVAGRVKKVFKAANSLLSRVEGAAKPGGHATQTKSSQPSEICCCCGEPVSCPCWVCITCVEDTYICMDCDAKRATALPDGVSPGHTLRDPLVQILDTEPIPEPLTADIRLSQLEAKLLGLDSKMAALEEKLDSRFGSLEAMLQGIAEKLTAKS